MNPEEPIPDLNNPWIIAAFEGWNDAGDAATGVIDHLLEHWDARVLVELDPEEFYDFQMNRPQVGFDESDGVYIEWPTTIVYYASPPGSDRDVLLIRGLEPNMRWRKFASTLMGIAELAGAQDLIALGALLADTPHTRPVPLTGTTTDQDLAIRLNLAPSRYSGPIGISTVLSHAASDQGLRTLSLWAAIPHYLAEPPCPKATLALLSRVEDAMGITLPEGDLAEEAQAWQRGADSLSESDDEIAEYVNSLENEKDTSDLPEASGDAIAREFERYLRRRNHDDDEL
ncbi:MAG: carboxylate--amine ligase [Nocardioidaceae bacterium]|nr:carboxylate--amine ligase [Nocardioidaceae bacterium]